jgi:hypothetical protein
MELPSGKCIQFYVLCIQVLTGIDHGHDGKGEEEFEKSGFHIF